MLSCVEPAILTIGDTTLAGKKALQPSLLHISSLLATSAVINRADSFSFGSKPCRAHVYSVVSSLLLPSSFTAIMAQLSCERRTGNIIRVDDHLEIEFHRTSIDPNPELADMLPDDGIFPLHFLQRDSNGQQFDEAKCRGLYLHMKRESHTSKFTHTR